MIDCSEQLVILKKPANTETFELVRYDYNHELNK